MKAIVSFMEIPQKKQPIVQIITTVQMGTKSMVRLISGLTNTQKSILISTNHGRKD